MQAIINKVTKDFNSLKAKYESARYVCPYLISSVYRSYGWDIDYEDHSGTRKYTDD